MATTYHAEHVGSLLRPPYLLRAREAHEAGELTTAQLREAEDRAIAELLEIQEQAGLTVFTDGETRRESWRAGLLESLGGVEPASRTLRWYRDGKELSPEETLSDGAVAVTKVSRKQDLTGVGVEHPGDGADQRRLPGPVAARDRDDLTVADLQADLAQHGERPERLGQLAHVEQRGATDRSRGRRQTGGTLRCSAGPAHQRLRHYPGAITTRLLPHSVYALGLQRLLRRSLTGPAGLSQS